MEIATHFHAIHAHTVGLAGGAIPETPILIFMHVHRKIAQLAAAFKCQREIAA